MAQGTRQEVCDGDAPIEQRSYYIMIAAGLLATGGMSAARGCLDVIGWVAKWHYCADREQAEYDMLSS